MVDCNIDDLMYQKTEVEFIERVSLADVEKRIATQPFVPKCGVLIDLLKQFLSKNTRNNR